MNGKSCGRDECDLSNGGSVNEFSLGTFSYKILKLT